MSENEWPDQSRAANAGDASNDSSSGVETSNNLVLTRQQMIDQLTRFQHELCAYATVEGDGRSCDCKFWPGLAAFPVGRGEITGCPELRSAIRVLKALP
jgi:hypothetical protein